MCTFRVIPDRHIMLVKGNEQGDRGRCGRVKIIIYICECKEFRGMRL
jgi:hypothetical protein